MSNNPFAAPAAPSSGVQWKDLNGSLLLIEPESIESGIATAYGEAEAVRANVHVLDGSSAGEVHEDTLVFPTILRSQLRPRVGEKVLGRLTQGAAKPGQSPPWVLAEATEADVQAGTEYLNRSQANSLTAPAQPQAQAPAPQAAPAGQPPF